MKTLSLETSKRLEPFLENVETEYFYSTEWTLNKLLEWDHRYLRNKTLTLEEAIEFLPSHHCCKINDLEQVERLTGNKEDKYWMIIGDIWLYWNTLLEAVEKMIIYLLDNDLLW